MADGGKKISFGFSKSTKKANFGLNSRSTQEKIELIDCVESQTIKIKDALEEIYTPLIIPMTKSNSVLLQRKRYSLKQEDCDDRPDSELTPDELAARELIREAQNSLLTGESKNNLTLPMVFDDSELNKDKDESTLEDYENIPISDYGLAMLRGMGWKEGTGIGKTSSITKVKEPNLRPKGMGLGANMVLKKVAEVNGEELVLKKGGFAKIIAGKQKGQYCEVQGFDDEAGRIIVKTTLQGLILALNEFLVIPVTKEEYTKSSKVINNAKYEEYINKEAQLSSSSQETSKIQKLSQSCYESKPRNIDTKDKDRKKCRSYHNGYDHTSRSMKKEHRKKYSNSSDSDQEYCKNNKERSKHRH